MSGHNADHNKEIQFARTLEEVRLTAKQQGNLIAGEQIREAFAGQELSETQFSLIYDYLKKYKIGVDEAVDPDEYMTDEEKNYLQDYLRGLEDLKRYSAEEKQQALLTAITGEHSCQESLLEIYLPEVTGIAKLYTDQGILLEDLIGEGNMALTAATGMLVGEKTPESAEGFLIQKIMDAMVEMIAVADQARKTDQKMEEKVNAVAAAAAELAGALGRKVTVKELSAESGIPERTVREAVRISGNVIEEIEIEKI